MRDLDKICEEYDRSRELLERKRNAYLKELRKCRELAYEIEKHKR